MRAHYQIHIPNTHRQVALATHHYLTSGPFRGITHANVSFGHPHDTLEVMGEESPELDSHMKQTGAFVGEVANAPVINVIKRGKGAPVHWPIRNLQYQPMPAGGPPQMFGPDQPEGPLPTAAPGQSQGQMPAVAARSTSPRENRTSP